jgi:hypothetical protein
MKSPLLAVTVALALAACSRAERPLPGPQAASEAPAASARPIPASPSAPPSEQPIMYFPEKERVLAGTDNSGNDMRWQPLGMAFPALLGQVRFVLILTDTPLVDRDGNSKGTLLFEGTRVTLLESGDWMPAGGEFRRMYRVRANVPGRPVQGWVDSSAAALMLVEADGLAVGIMPRKLVVGGGESEYSLLVIAEGRRVTLVDTSVFPFPDTFHPSGVVQVSLEDMNSDSQPEILLEAETIVSLRFLGATPVRWKAWLHRREGSLVPIFRYNVSFGSDTGYSYTATDRLFDSTGDGIRNMVRVDTDYTVVSGPDEFRTTTVSFFPWNGVEFKKAPLEDLPKIGTVTAETASLLADPDEHSSVTATLSRGDRLYAFDRSDTRLSRDDPSSWWYKAVTKSGVQGWINGTQVELTWIDALKLNREAFLGPG